MPVSYAPSEERLRGEGGGDGGSRARTGARWPVHMLPARWMGTPSVPVPGGYPAPPLLTPLTSRSTLPDILVSCFHLLRVCQSRLQRRTVRDFLLAWPSDSLPAPNSLCRRRGSSTAGWYCYKGAEFFERPLKFRFRLDQVSDQHLRRPASTEPDPAPSVAGDGRPGLAAWSLAADRERPGQKHWGRAMASPAPGGRGTPRFRSRQGLGQSPTLQRRLTEHTCLSVCGSRRDRGTVRGVGRENIMVSWRPDRLIRSRSLAPEREASTLAVAAAILRGTGERCSRTRSADDGRTGGGTSACKCVCL